MDRDRMQQAIADFLDAAGVDLKDPEIRETPRRVTETWANEYLLGYRQGPADVLSSSETTDSHAEVVLTGIGYVSICPHHLLPYGGVAHLAYLPGGKLAGFGNLVRLVETLASRLVLQETLAANICDAVVEGLGARGAACILDGQPVCVATRGVRQPDVIAHCSAYRGEYATDTGETRRALHDAVRTWRRDRRK